MRAKSADNRTRTREHDPSAELGLRDPVRDKAKLGDTQYGVTPPREEVESPQTSGGAASCSECNKALDPAHPYRADGEEYAYHFCNADCHAHWRARHLPHDDPRLPKT